MKYDEYLVISCFLFVKIVYKVIINIYIDKDVDILFEKFNLRSKKYFFFIELNLNIFFNFHIIVLCIIARLVVCLEVEEG